MGEAATYVDLEADDGAPQRREVTVHDHAPMPEPVEPVTPLTMLNRAVASGHSPETVEKMMALYERWEAAQARKAFEAAVAGAKARISAVPILKNKTGHNSKRYADFAAYAAVIDPIISEFGLSYRFRTRQDERIHVSCVLSHEDGHSEENTLAGPPDTTGNKNAIQAIGSTLTYLQRYTLVQALGLAASDDDDGKAGGAGELVAEAQVDELRQLVMDVDADLPKLLAFLKSKLGIERLEDTPVSKLDEVKWIIEQKRKDKKKEPAP